MLINDFLALFSSNLVDMLALCANLWKCHCWYSVIACMRCVLVASLNRGGLERPAEMQPSHTNQTLNPHI